METIFNNNKRLAFLLTSPRPLLRTGMVLTASQRQRREGRESIVQMDKLRPAPQSLCLLSAPTWPDRCSALNRHPQPMAAHCLLDKTQVWDHDPWGPTQTSPQPHPTSPCVALDHCSSSEGPGPPHLRSFAHGVFLTWDTPSPPVHLDDTCSNHST